MIFCPKCSSMLRPKTEGDIKVMSCSCGFKSDAPAIISFKESVGSKKSKAEKRNDAVVEDDKEMLPVADAFCGKCKNNKAYYWLVQTRAADEAPTKFMRCTKCKNTWRDYS